jgi:hypothetical protein
LANNTVSPSRKQINQKANPLPGSIIRCHTEDKTLRELYETLKAWRFCNPSSTRLDGCQNGPNNRSWVVFRYRGVKYNLAGDTTSRAVDRFLEKYSEVEGKISRLFELHGGTKLRIFGESTVAGWFCCKGGGRETMPMSKIDWGSARNIS